MRTAILFAALALAGCHRAPPLPAKPAPVHPSILVDPPYPGQKQAGAMPAFPGCFPVGQSGSDNDRLAGLFHGRHDYTLSRGDKKDVDPVLVDESLRRWIEAAPGVTVTSTATLPGPDGVFRKTLNYATADTIGYAVWEIQPAVPSPKVRYTLQVQERRK